MENTARWIGYGTALAILATLLSLLSALRGELSSPSHLIRVRFPETGTLRPQDPITRSGVVVGRVHSVAPDSSAALVSLELFDKRPLRADARFVNFNHSLMGDRMVVLVPGTSSQNMDESQVQAGLFANGVAETIHQVDGLLKMVLRINSLSHRWKGPSDSADSWSGTLNQKIYPAFDEITRLGAALSHARQGLEPDITELEHSTQQIADLAVRVHAKADTLTRFAATSLVRLDSLSRLGEGLVLQVDSLMQLSVGPHSGLRPLLLERTLYDRTLQLTETLRAALSILTVDGLDIIHAKNLHLRRTHSSSH